MKDRKEADLLIEEIWSRNKVTSKSGGFCLHLCDYHNTPFLFRLNFDFMALGRRILYTALTNRSKGALALCTRK
ncbi:hypothetical protein EYC84_005241 [Monilinia fructicola]|uniref:Uncharacterized protein n=1 Tax=Monilinia fructicola TaxID=38448 RepID=A0A5M9JZR3_MONFR|nr:hypothetical protein EYC84_005241 [Monilinia fructicola]